MMRALAKSVVLAVRGGSKQLKRQAVKRLYAGRHAGARRARQTLARELPAPPFRDALEREAFVEWSGFVSPDMLTALQAEAAEAEAAQSRSKDFFELLSPGRPLRTSDASVRIALDPRLVAAVTAYFGEVPYLLSSELIRSRRTAASPAWKKSQLWHFDHNDTRVLKLFVYLNDVGDNNGPFTYIPMHPAQARLPYLPVHKSDAQITRHLGSNTERSITGAQGTTFLIDTARLLHRGSRIDNDTTRLVLIVTYTSFAQLVPRDNGIEVDRPLSAIEQQLLRKS